jgi:hypothetical protein
MNLGATADVRVPTVSSIMRGSFARRRVTRVESLVMGQNDQGGRSTQAECKLDTGCKLKTRLLTTLPDHEVDTSTEE